MSFNFEEILKEARENGVNKFEEANAGAEKVSGEAPLEVCEMVLQGIQTEAGSGATPTETFAATATLLQKGATSPKTPGGTKFCFGKAEVSVEMIRKHCKKNKITVRQLARGLKDKIMEFMMILGEKAPQGNQSRNMKLELKNVTHEEAVWASDFNTYNENCPDRVRIWLVNSYRRRFRYLQNNEY